MTLQVSANNSEPNGVYYCVALACFARRSMSLASYSIERRAFAALSLLADLTFESLADQNWRNWMKRAPPSPPRTCVCL